MFVWCAPHRGLIPLFHPRAQGHQEAASSDDETPPPAAAAAAGISKEVLRARHKVSRCIHKALQSGKPLVISSLPVRAEEGKAAEAVAAPITFVTADADLLKAFTMEVLSEVVIDVPQAAEEDGGNVREDAEKRRAVPRAAKTFPEECLPQLVGSHTETETDSALWLLHIAIVRH